MKIQYTYCQECNKNKRAHLFNEIDSKIVCNECKSVVEFNMLHKEAEKLLNQQLR